MKQLAIILISIIGAIVLIVGGFFIFAIVAFNDYPTDLIITSSSSRSDDAYYINDQKVPLANPLEGFCLEVRDDDDFTISLQRDELKEARPIKNSFRFSIGERSGDDLSLSVVQQGADGIYLDHGYTCKGIEQLLQ